MRLRFLDWLLDRGRRQRARQAAQPFSDPEFRGAAERVFFFIERVTGVRPAEVDLDQDVGPLVARRRSSEVFWARAEMALTLDEPRRLHVFENLRVGSVRHLMQHLCICPMCRASLGAEH